MVDKKSLLRVIKVFGGTTVDGPGLRTSIYFAGCRHHCKGCHNPDSWDFNAGEDMTVEDILLQVRYYRFNVTMSGGDPLYQDLDVLAFLCQEIHKLNLTIWLYTGYVFEELVAEKKYDKVLKNIDVLVDGPFILERRSTEILFRGSDNQRILSKDNNNVWKEVYKDKITDIKEKFYE